MLFKGHDFRKGLAHTSVRKLLQRLDFASLLLSLSQKRS